MAYSFELDREFRDAFKRESQSSFEIGESQPISSPLLRRIALMLARIGVKIHFEISECPIHHDESFRGHKERLIVSSQVETKQIKTKWWHLLHRTIAVYLCLKQFLLVIIHYIYDFHKIQYNKLHEGDLFSSANRKSSETFSGQNYSQSALILENRINQIENILIIIGSPWREVSMLVECAQVFLILNTVIYYVITTIYCRFIGKLNISLARFWFDEKREQDNIIELILDEIDKLIQISRHNLVKTVKDYHSYVLNKNGVSKTNNNPNSNVKFNPDVQALFEEHHSTVRLLKRLALAGSLQPSNRNLDWIFLTRILYVTLYSIFFLFSFLGGLVLVFFVPSYIDVPVGDSLTDSIAFIEVLIMGMESSMLVSLILSQLIVVFVDQSYEVHTLKKRIDNCIKTNEILHQELVIMSSNDSHNLGQCTDQKHVPKQQYLAPPQQVFDKQSTSNQSQLIQSHIDSMNENLLNILMTYRIFVRQFQPLRHLFGLLLFLYTSIYVIYPILIIINVPYLSRIKCLVLICLLWSCVVVYNISTSPICLYHAHCNHLFKQLFSLVAHVDEIQAGAFPSPPYVDSNDLCRTYNPSLASLLRKEIHESDLAIRRVSIMILNSQFSFRYVLKVIFWTGILTVYALTSNENVSKLHNVKGASILGAFV